MKTVLITFLLLLLGGCNARNIMPVNKQTDLYVKNTTPIPIKYAFEGAEGSRKLKEAFKICDEKSGLNKKNCYINLLTNSNTDYKILIKDVSGSFKLAGSNLSVENNSYRIIFTWSKNVWIKNPDVQKAYEARNSEQNIYKSYGYDEAYHKIGIGVEIVAQLDEVESGVNLSNILSSTAQFDSKSTKGSIQIRRIGINGKVTEVLIPGSPKKFSRDSIADTIDSLQKVQLLLYSEDDIILEPSTLGYLLPQKYKESRWVYLGQYDDLNVDVLYEDQFEVASGKKTINKLVGEKIKTLNRRALSVDRPRFPFYSEGEIVDYVKKNCTFNIVGISNVINDHIWAVVTKDKNCTK